MLRGRTSSADKGSAEGGTIARKYNKTVSFNMTEQESSIVAHNPSIPSPNDNKSPQPLDSANNCSDDEIEETK